MKMKRTVISKWKRKSKHGDENMAMVVYHSQEAGKTISVTKHEKV